MINLITRNNMEAAERANITLGASRTTAAQLDRLIVSHRPYFTSRTVIRHPAVANVARVPSGRVGPSHTPGIADDAISAA